MILDTRESTLIVTMISELSATTAAEFKARLRAAFVPGLLNIDVSLAGLSFIDSSGLGALISANRLAVERGGRFRVLSPTPPVLQVLELTRMHRILEIAP